MTIKNTCANDSTTAHSGLLPPNHLLSKPASPKSRPDALRRIAAKQGWYHQQAGLEATPHVYQSEMQREAYLNGYAIARSAPKNQKHPFGEITNPRVPA